MPTSIPDGSAGTTFTITAPDRYVLAPGATRRQTAGTAVQATVASGQTIIDIEGTLDDTASGSRAIRANVAAGQLVVGAQGIVQALDADAVQTQGANARFDVDNAGRITSATSIGTITSTGSTPPSAAYALNFNAAVGIANAPSSDVTSGGVITNGSASNAAALIESTSGDAIRLGAHETLINYGRIAGSGPVNDSSSNNTFSGTSTAQRYDISRGVRINAGTSTNDRIENHGLIEGSQHGVDVGNTAATNIQIDNRAGATILGHNGSGVGADTTGTSAGTVVVTNAGTIRGEYAPTYDRAGLATADGDGDGVDVDGAATVVNLAGGLIAGSGANGVLNGRGAGGYDGNGRANRSEGLSLGGGSVTNSGTISGADTAIVVNNDSNPDGSRSGVLATTIINNASGSIIGQAGYAIRLENKTGNAATDNDTVVNYGSITGNGTVPTGTVNRQDGQPDPGTVGTLNGVAYTLADAGNARFIQGDGAAIQTGEGADSLSDYGTITGNSGRAISLEGGDDTLNLYTGSTITGRIDGGAGTDTLNLRRDDRSGAGDPGANSNATTGTLADIVGFEALMVRSGAWTITDAQSYTGGATIASGATLQIGNGGAGASFTGPIVDGGTVAFDATDDTLYAGALTGAGTLAKLGTGTLTLTGANDGFSGAVSLAAGTLDLAQPSSAGTGTITFGAGSQVLRLDAAPGRLGTSVAGFGAGDIIDLTGLNPAGATARFDGATLTVSGLALAGGGAFAETIAISAAPAGYQYSVVSDTTGGGGADVILTALPASPAGPASPSAGSDSLSASASGNDTIAGLGGDDTIQGGDGNQLLLGNQGNDVITAGNGLNTIAGGMGDDRIIVGNGADLIYGNEGSDSIQAGNGNNTIVGGLDSTDGADLITTGSGNDLILGNGGDDTAAAGNGADTVVGGYGRDVLLGNQSDDVLLGNQGDDTLFGGQGGDTVVGGMGNDVLYGNQGDDLLYGNEGLNTFVFAPGDTDFRSNLGTGDAIADFATGRSRIDFGSGPAGTAQTFKATATTATDFASIQAAAQALIDGGDTYAFVADGIDGFLFTTGGTGTAITDAVKLAGAGSATALQATDIAHGVLA
jgi:autotransporter-associated beta strand protein